MSASRKEEEEDSCVVGSDLELFVCICSCHSVLWSYSLPTFLVELGSCIGAGMHAVYSHE